MKYGKDNIYKKANETVKRTDDCTIIRNTTPWGCTSLFICKAEEKTSFRHVQRDLCQQLYRRGSTMQIWMWESGFYSISSLGHEIGILHIQRLNGMKWKAKLVSDKKERKVRDCFVIAEVVGGRRLAMKSLTWLANIISSFFRRTPTGFGCMMFRPVPFSPRAKDLLSSSSRVPSWVRSPILRHCILQREWTNTVYHEFGSIL
jgi:hypothetical protein